MDDADRTEATLKLSNNLHTFIDHVNALREEDDPSGNGFTREFRGLRELGQRMREENTHPADEGRKPHNIKKNRYKDILPFDSTRVTLDEVEGLEGSDYINANFIKDPSGNQTYIASQGPLPATVNDFWRMLWQYKVKVVVMACKLVELGRKKCEQYWPDEEGETTSFGDIDVTLNAEEQMGENCMIRKLKMELDGESGELIQYHYTGWPDHDIPDDIDIILEMIAGMREIRDKDSDKSPIVVHCSAGCGRTGTICAIDYSWDVLKSVGLVEEFSLYEIIKHMREQRQSMIQAPEQYEMAHLTVRRLFEEHLEMIEDHEYANVQFVPQEEDVTDTKSTSTTPESRRKHSAVQSQINQTIQNYANITIGGQVHISQQGEAPQPETRPVPAQRPVTSPKIKDMQNFFSERTVEQKEVPVEKEVLRQTEAPPPLKPIVKTRPESLTSKPQPPPSPVKQKATPELSAQTVDAKQRADEARDKKRAEDRQKVMHSDTKLVNDGGRFRTVISLQKSLPTTTSSNMAKTSSAPIKAKSLPHGSSTNTQVSSSTFFLQDTFAPESPTAQQSNSVNSDSVYTQVGQSNFYRSAKEEKVATGDTPPSDLYAVVNKQRTEGPADGAMYAVVDKKQGNASQNGSVDEYSSAYEHIHVGRTASGTGDVPPIPDRGYIQPEVTPQEQERSAGDTTTLGKKNITNKIKNLFTSNKSSSSDNVASTGIPGYSNRFGKKPSGPREPPSSWSKS